MKKKKVLFIIISIFLFGIVTYLSLGEISFSCDDSIYFSSQYKIEYGTNYSLPKVKAIYHLPLLNKTFTVRCKVKHKIDNKILGEYKVTYSSSFFFSSSKKEIIVQIRDTLPPVIDLIDNPDYWIWPSEDYVEEGYSAYDNYDGDVTDKVIISKNEDGSLTYSVTDSLGNQNEIIRNIKYKDTDAPIITVNANYVAFKVGSTFEYPVYSANDIQDGDVSSAVIVEDTIKADKVGCYKITYSVQDRWGNKAIKEIPVYVYRNQPKTSTTSKINKSIYLTFDDGPSAYTSKLLDILDKYNVKVTFFVTNTKPSYVNMIGEAYRRGHAIAVHTYSHNYGLIYSSEQAFWEDNTKMNEIIYQQTGQYANIMRFPGGTSNTVSRYYKKGIMTSLASSTSVMGFRYFDWNVDSNDAGGASSSQEVFENVKYSVSRKTFAVVLQHDSKSFSVDAVEQIICWGLANGYTFLPITSTTPTCVHPSYN